MVAYDVSDAGSFKHIDTWLDTIKQVSTINCDALGHDMCS